MTVQLEARNANLEDLAKILQTQQDAKLDLVAPAAAAMSEHGVIAIAGTGVFEDQRFRPSALADGHLAEKLGIPVAYLRRLREDRIDLYDANVNGWLRGIGKDDLALIRGFDPVAPDPRSFLWRTFQGAPGEPGYLRSVLSDRYGIIENLDVLTAALAGVRDSGVETVVEGCDLSENRMRVRVAAPAVAALAPVLMAGYRSPFAQGEHRAGDGDALARWGLAAAAREGMGYKPGEEPIVFAGFEISNGENGGAAFLLTPRIIVQICRNGLTIKKDALRSIHLGGQLDHGVIKWSEDTQRKSLELVTAQARDAVATFLDQDYVEMVVERLERDAGKVLDKPAEQVTVITEALGFSQVQRDGILDHFIKGGQATAGGVLQAVTSYAQVVDNPDTAADLEAVAMDAFQMAVAL